MNEKSAKKYIWICWLAIGGVLVLPDVLLACPNCKNTVGWNSDALALGFAVSIGLLLLAPLSILAFWGTLILRLSRTLRGDIG